MMSFRVNFLVGVLSVPFAGFALLAGAVVSAQGGANASSSGVMAATSNAVVTPSPVLVELFTSEGCSSCPPADELLRQLNETKTKEGQLVIGLSEHVSYWNGLGWKDPFSAEVYTDRQSNYSTRFHTEGSYTPQMVVNGREQFVGSSRGDFERAVAEESARHGMQVEIVAVHLNQNAVDFSYRAQGGAPGVPYQLMAALVDDSDRSNVARGENGGRLLTHVFVARALAPVDTLRGNKEGMIKLPLPQGFMASAQAHHLVLFAQEHGLGPVSGVDAKAF